MSFTFNGSNQYLSLSRALVSGTPLTMACWAKPTTTAAGLMAIVNSASTSAVNRFTIFSSDPSQEQLNVLTGGASASGTATKSTAIQGHWNHLAAVITSATSRLAYVNGVAGTVNATSETPSGLNQSTIGAITVSGTAGSFLSGKIAYCTFWNIALTAAQIAQLAAGVDPATIAPGNIVAHLPLLSSITDTIGNTWTNNNTATLDSSDNPPVSDGHTLFLKQPANSLAAYSTFNYANIVRSVLASTTAVTNTTTSGTKVPLTLTAGGAAAKWISPPFAVAATIAGTIQFNGRGLENSASANVGLGFDILRDSDGASIVSSNKGTEFTTADAPYNWTATPTSTLIGVGDRIQIIPHLSNVGTMTSGFTGSMSYGGHTNFAAGDTYVTFTETLQFQAEPEFIQWNIDSDVPAQFSFPSAPNNLIVVGLWVQTFASGGSVTLTSITDNASNTYSTATGPTTVLIGGTGPSTYTILYTINTGTPGQTLTLTPHFSGSATGSYYLNCAEYAGIKATSPLDSESPAIAIGNTGTTATSGTANSVASNSIVIGFGDIGASGTIAVGSGFISRTGASCSIEDKALNATANNSASFALTGVGTIWLAGMAAFEAAFQPGTIYNVAPAETLTISDTDSGVIDHTSTASDSITISDASSEILQVSVSSTDSITLSDTNAGFFDGIRSLTDNLTLADANSETLQVSVSSTDSITISDANTNNIDGTSTTSDSLTITALTTGGIDRTSTTSDSITLSDVSSQTVQISVSASETLTISDVDSATRETLPSLSDTITPSDLAAGGFDVTSTTSDSITLSDASSESLDVSASSTDSLTINITLSSSLIASNTITDSLILGDTSSGNFDETDIASDTLTLSDLATGGFDVTLSASDTLTLTATATGNLDTTSAITSTITTIDANTGNIDIAKTCAETLTLIATSTGNIDTLKSLFDSFTLTDATSQSIIVSLATSDNITLSTTTSNSLTTSSSTSETFTISDFTAEVLTITNVISSSMTISDVADGEIVHTNKNSFGIFQSSVFNSTIRRKH